MRRMRISWRMILVSKPLPLASEKTSLMSPLSARFSSSSRSIRSMNERNRSPAIPPMSGIQSPLLKKPKNQNQRRPLSALRSMLRLRRGESGLLLGARFLLVLLAPFVIGHAVDDLARFGIAEPDALLLGCGAVPFRQAVAAEAGEVHQIDVLHIGALAQMRDERAERRRFKLGAGLVVHLPTSSYVLYVASPAAILNALLQWLSL